MALAGIWLLVSYLTNIGNLLRWGLTFQLFTAGLGLMLPLDGLCLFLIVPLAVATEVIFTFNHQEARLWFKVLQTLVVYFVMLWITGLVLAVLDDTFSSKKKGVKQND